MHVILSNWEDSGAMQGTYYAIIDLQETSAALNLNIKRFSTGLSVSMEASFMPGGATDANGMYEAYSAGYIDKTNPYSTLSNA